MTLLTVKGNTFFFGDQQFRCAIGKGGFSNDKREGDGCSPVGVFTLRECWYRLDRLAPPETKLPLKIIRENDGWCDDSESPEYNTHVRLPYHYSHEKLWRDDHVYDLIVPLGYNDDPIINGRGSAIFMHLAHNDYKPTEGCVALALHDLITILPHLNTQTSIEILPK